MQYTYTAGMYKFELTVPINFKGQTFFFGVAVPQPWIGLKSVILLIQIYSCNFCMARGYTVTITHTVSLILHDTH